MASTADDEFGPDGPPDEPPPALDPDELVQMNVRVPRRVRDEVDARRAKLDMSRDRWVVRALLWALRQPMRPQRRARTVATTERGRSIKTPRSSKP